MAYGVNDVLHDMAEHSGVPFARLRVDGGATANDWLMQFQADILGVPVERPDQLESTALGAAGLAGLAAGIWNGAEDFIARRSFDTFEPRVERGDADSLIAGWRRAVGVALAWARAGRDGEGVA
jgi:glycerol kinase